MLRPGNRDLKQALLPHGDKLLSVGIHRLTLRTAGESEVDVSRARKDLRDDAALRTLLDDPSALVRDHDAVLIDFIRFNQAERRERTALFVEGNERFQICIGEIVATDDDERIGEERLQRLKRARAAHQLDFVQIIELHTVARAVAERRFDRIGNFNWICPYRQEMTHSMALSLAAMLCLYRFAKNFRPHWLAISGLLTGLVFLTKAEVFFQLFVAMLAGIALISRKHGVARHAILFIAAAATPAIAAPAA